MSILDSITAAEQAAVQQKQEASVKARELVREAEAQANQKAAELIDAAQKAAQKDLAQAQETSAKKADSLLQEQREKDQAMMLAAQAKLQQAVSTIVERIEKK